MVSWKELIFSSSALSCERCKNLTIVSDIAAESGRATFASEEAIDKLAVWQMDTAAKEAQEGCYSGRPAEVEIELRINLPRFEAVFKNGDLMVLPGDYEERLPRFRTGV